MIAGKIMKYIFLFLCSLFACIFTMFYLTAIASKNKKDTSKYVTSIFFKTVPDFSFNKEDGKKSLIFQKICAKTD